jgi:hypothetical protein
MKLYEVPRNSKIIYTDSESEIKYLIDFKHIDGMYSLCYLNGEPIHLSASTEVEVVNEDK